jgi:hypothetical protein
MKKIAIIAALMLVALTACKKEPIANFEINVGCHWDPGRDIWDDGVIQSGTWGGARESQCPFFVGIHNTSKNAVTYEWEWGDGGYDCREEPTYIYDEAGTYTITLTAYNEEGQANSVSKNITVKE